ncbi:hypothetical protein [Paraburkholderia xenovorans]|uniref:hypothetical protein n=1 Tax=Paraburkholderia xenovorans TaxID=36873 RepID=UPI0038B6C2B6
MSITATEQDGLQLTMQDEPHALLQSDELGVLAQTLNGMGVRVEVGRAHVGVVAERPALVLRVGGASGPVISASSRGVDFGRTWDGLDGDLHTVASIAIPALLVAYPEASSANVPWALDIAAELAVLMLSTQPPERAVLHIAVPQMLTGRVPHVVSSERAARALFVAGKMTVSPFRWGGSTLEFGVEQEQWVNAAVRVLSPRLGGTSGFCGCCSSNDAAAYVSNYSERS